MLTSRAVLIFALTVLLGATWGGRSAAQERLAIGGPLPSIDSSLRRLDGTRASPSGLTGPKGTVFLFWSNRCPWVEKYENRVQALVTEFRGRGIRFVLVNANDPSRWPAESLDSSRARARKHGYEALYVQDPDGAFARALGATRTPQAFLFNQKDQLVYVGAIDDSPGIPEQVETSYLRNALEAILKGASVASPEKEALGCTLKRSG